MPNLNIRHADASQRRDAGPLTAVHIFHKARREMAMSPLWLVRHLDDVEPYDADNLAIEKVFVAVRRYISQPADHYTVWVDCARAREEGFHPMQVADATLAYLGVGPKSLAWTNVELADEP